MDQAPDTRRLVEDAKNGDREAFRTIYERYGSRIYGFLYRLIGSRHEAEDATQQTFLIALKQLGTLRDPNMLESWIYRIARNELYQKFRRKQADSLDEGSLKLFAEKMTDTRLHGQPEKILLNQELSAVIQSVLMCMPLKLREVFFLAVFEEKSYQDISKIVGRSLLSVKTDIYRARLIAKEKIGGYLISGDRPIGQKQKRAGQ